MAAKEMYGNLGQSRDFSLLAGTGTERTVGVAVKPGSGLLARGTIIQMGADGLYVPAETGKMADGACAVLESDTQTGKMCIRDRDVPIGGRKLSVETVKGVFARLTPDHIRYVTDSLKNVSAPIRNPKSYLLTSLYLSLIHISGNSRNHQAPKKGGKAGAGNGC